MSPTVCNDRRMPPLIGIVWRGSPPSVTSNTAPSFHRDFVVGVATYAFELFTAVVDLDSVYVPIGLGSGGVIGTRDLLDLNPIVNPTRAVGEPSRTEPTGALVDGGIRRVASQHCAYS